MTTITLKSTAGKWVMASSILASSMAFIDSTALNVVLPSLQKSLNASGTDLFWVLNAYLLMLASFILMGGSLGDKLGRKKIFMIGILIFIIGSLACGFAPTVLLLIIFRALQGIGGALMIPGSLSLISTAFNPKERGKAIGTWSAITTMVTMGGPILGGALGDAGLWRYIFFINIPIGLISILILWFKVKESRDEELSNQVDFPGAITTVLGLALLTFGFLRIPETGINNPQVYLSLGGGIIFLAVFIFIEMRIKNPMMPLTLFLNKTFSGVNLLTFFLYAGLSAGLLFVTLNMIQVQGYSQLQAGLTLLPFTILMVGIARFAGNFSDNYGPRWLLIAGPSAAGLGLLLLSFVKQTAGPSEYWTSFFPGILVFGLGMAFTVAPLTSTVMGSVATHFSGTASGVNNAVTRIASVFANAILGALALVFFSAYLGNVVKDLPVNQTAKQSIMAEVGNLGDAKVPANLNKENTVLISNVYKQGFSIAYAKVMTVCAGLAFSGALMSFLFIKNEAVEISSKVKSDEPLSSG